MRLVYIHFREDDTSVIIEDYHLSDSRFSIKTERL